MSVATLVETRLRDFPYSFENEACARVRRPAPTHTMQRSNSTSSPFHRSASDISISRALSVQSNYPDREAPIVPPKRALSGATLHNNQPGSAVDGIKEQHEEALSIEPTKPKQRGRQTKSPKTTVSKYILREAPSEVIPEQHAVSDKGTDLEDATTPENSDSTLGEKKLRSKSSLHSLKRRTSWLIMRSRSPSPSSQKSLVESSSRASSPLSRSSEDVSLKQEDAASQAPSENDKVPPLRRHDTAATAKGRRPLSAFLGKPRNSAPEPSLAPPLGKSFSADRLPSYGRHLDAPDLPPAARRERTRPPVAEGPRKRDELWTVFRQLDSDFSKFHSKPSNLKVTTVRTTLLPFLRTYAHHPSNLTLRAEDLDRRVSILNRWWMGLLEMINGRNGQIVSGSDRPAVLDGLTGIMVRPEWRASVTTMSGRSMAGTPGSQSSTSLDSWGSDFVTESVLHNVRNMFVQNLLSQMAFVVDRMSLRNIPASIVTFCGKAAAYAFLFCPGVADILVRLWGVPQNNVRRVLDEYSVPRSARLDDTAADVARFFPPHLKPLGLASLATLMRTLRNPRPRSIVLDRIRWTAPWVGRWAGRDSDLFFCFVKSYHGLSCELLPEEATRLERLCAPGAVLVQAQLLSLMDLTMHRGGLPNNPEAPDNTQPVTFDDVLGADVPANPLPPRAPNAVRLMAENRLIRIIREFLLSDSTSVSEVARSTFARMFCNLLQAATRRISVYDQNACFTLCDFLEEAIAILVRYHRDPNDAISFLAWDFWFSVLKQMASSNNSMIDIRLYAFVYSLWGLLARDSRRRKDICIHWLLDGEYFYQHFNHWCPMVRAYYMRLLCWRVGRYNGDATDVDLPIFCNLSDKLTKIWCHYLYLQREAEKGACKLLSTFPSDPVPGRRLLIIRDDNVPAPRSLTASFDALMAASADPSAYQKYSSLDPINNLSRSSTVVDRDRPPPRSPSPVPNKRWTHLKNMLPFGSGNGHDPKPDGLSIDTKVGPGNVVPTRTASPAKSGPTSPDHGSAPDTPVKTSGSFKFSLEWSERAGAAPRKGANRKLVPPRLPHTAQSIMRSLTTEAEPRSMPVAPTGWEIGPSKYTGRALAEWWLLLLECQNFFERRKAEGVTSHHAVETPTLTVENFRKPAG